MRDSIEADVDQRLPMKAPGLLVRRSLERRPAVLGAAALMFVGLFIALRYVEDPAYGVGLLAVVPITLLGLELGLRGGAAATGLGLAILITGALSGHPDLGMVGVTTRGLVFAAIGLIAGRFSDRMREAQRRGALTLQSGLALNSLPDRRGLPALVAESAMSAVAADGARATLDDLGEALCGDCANPLAAVAVDVRGEPVGRIEVARRRPLTAEDLAALRLLALQAGLALDNQLLLERERERAAVEAQLRTAQLKLSEQRSELDYLVNDQEQERSRVAEKLHEELAQVLAAVLWGLERMPTDAAGAPRGPLPELRQQVVSVLDDLRELAGSLRPASLDQLGLVSALEYLAERTRAEAGVNLSISAGPVPARLPDTVQTGVYRIVEDAIGVLGDPDGGSPAVRVELSESGDVLRTVLTLPLRSERATSLAAIRGRVEVLDGTLRTEAVGRGITQLVVQIPLAGAAGRAERPPVLTEHVDDGRRAPVSAASSRS
jgi:signal transduction histidine kinase